MERKFQFLIGSLQTPIRTASHQQRRQFQFLIGSLQTQRMLEKAPPGIDSFNSL